MRYETVEVLAACYKGKMGSTLSHTLGVGADKSLCGIPEAHLTNVGFDQLPPTCLRCAKKDPRTPKGPQDGPFVVKSKLQF